MIFEVYTDGACSGNPGRGGWAALIRSTEGIREIVGFDANTTNNRMELQAAIEGLQALPPTATVTLTSDSKYLINGMTQWLVEWKKRDWRTAAKKPVENRDLWEALDELDGNRVTWIWCRGHSGDPNNERVNALAQREAGGGRLEFNSKESVLITSIVASNDEGESPQLKFPCYLSLVNDVPALHSTWACCNSRTQGRSAKTKKCYSLDEVMKVLCSWKLPLELPEEWRGAEAVMPATISKTPPTISRMFARGVFDKVQSQLKSSGFLTQNDDNKEIDFHLVRGSAHAIGYKNGRLLAQGVWKPPDFNDWESLEKEEEKWVREALDSKIRSLTHFPFLWSLEIWDYLFIQLSVGNVRNWSAEPIGKHLLIREASTNQSVGVLSPRSWKSIKPKDVERISLSLHENRWQEGIRNCISTYQDQQNNLMAVSVPVSPAICSLASLWDWKATEKSDVKDQRRIANQIRSLLEYSYKSWTETEWRQAAKKIGNQVDVIVDWVLKVTLKLTAAPTKFTFPLEIIGNLGGNQDCTARLLEQRSGNNLKYRYPLLSEEYDTLNMAHFIARSQESTIHD